MSDAPKRKQGGQGGGGDRPFKKSKGGNAGAWQTTAHKLNLAKLSEKDAHLEAGGQGIWVTFVRGMDRKAIVEFEKLCNELGETIYGIAPPADEAAVPGEDDEDDIEASIRKEMEGFKSQEPKPKGAFAIVRADIECVFFLKTREPVDPVALCRRMCTDAKGCANVMERKTRYINRLTPVAVTGKVASGVDKVARQALAPWFQGVKAEDASEDAQKDAAGEGQAPYTYAIRPSIRANSDIKRNEVIDQVAGLIGKQHKVNLDNPDKVILIDVYKNFCGMSVVDGKEWEELKRYNINELHKAVAKPKGGNKAAEADAVAASSDAPAPVVVNETHDEEAKASS
ncbi:hypothetical protein D7B24_000832 [Verticillium nonalfalfae]|uniref:THUMP domain-containing protein n=1 Tax=Verticillium nonalfalfae TaxID=1051616 RepID=A0A3M9Y1L6_9PEZI|nr:uncharacterized protein D7B24_000832 [Verticillium nonalfalfae]RNJ54164.1 hypothetical protein D7B24_000832 [Verticillium nonalfalfae]